MEALIKDFATNNDFKNGYMDGYIDKLRIEKDTLKLLGNKWYENYKSRIAGCETSFFSGQQCTQGPKYMEGFKLGYNDAWLNDGTPPKYEVDTIGKLIEFNGPTSWYGRRWRNKKPGLTGKYEIAYTKGYLDKLTSPYLGLSYWMVYKPSEDDPLYLLGYERGWVECLDDNPFPPQFAERQISDVIMNNLSLWKSKRWHYPEEDGPLGLIPNKQQVNNMLDSVIPMTTFRPSTYIGFTPPDANKNNLPLIQHTKINKDKKKPTQAEIDNAMEMFTPDNLKENANKLVETGKDITNKIIDLSWPPGFIEKLAKTNQAVAESVKTSNRLAEETAKMNSPHTSTGNLYSSNVRPPQTHNLLNGGGCTMAGGRSKKSRRRNKKTRRHRKK